MCDARPRTCQEWQIVLKGIAEHREPDSTEESTMARMHALRCCHCWNVFSLASTEAARRGIEPVPPMPKRVVAEPRRPPPKEPIDFNLN